MALNLFFFQILCLRQCMIFAVEKTEAAVNGETIKS